MIFAGCDLGTTAAKMVIIENGSVLANETLAYKNLPRQAAIAVMQRALSKADLSAEQLDYCIATGFGKRPDYTHEWAENSDGDLFGTLAPAPATQDAGSRSLEPEPVLIPSNGRESEVVPTSTEEDLEIPAFIRRQNGQL